MGREKLGEFIRKFDYINAKKDGEGESIGNQFIDFERGCSRDITFAELKDGYKAFQEKCCVPRLGYRHSPSYWAAYSVANALQSLKSGFDEEPDSTRLEIGRLDVECWLALVEAGPNSAHADIMSKFRTDKAEKYLETCTKAELADIFKKMKIQFSFDSGDTDLGEQTYGSIMSDKLRTIFKDLSEEKFKMAQEEFLDLYLHYFMQLPHLSEELRTYVGYIVRDMPDKLTYAPPNGRSAKNPYVGCKNVRTLKMHIDALTDIVVTCDCAVSRFADILSNIVQALMVDKMLEPLFDSLMELCVKFAIRQNLPKDAEKIYDVYKLKLYRHLKKYMVPTASMFETCLNSLKALMRQVGDTLHKDFYGLIDEAVDECICVYTKMTPEQVKSLLDFVNMLLQSGHQKMIKLAGNVIRNETVKQKLIWKKYLDKVNLLLNTVSKQPYDKFFPERAGDKDLHWVIREYENFIERLLDQVVEAKAVSKLYPDLLEFVITCIEEFPEHKADMASDASDAKYFILKRPETGFLERILTKCGEIIKNEDLPRSTDMNKVIQNLLIAVTETYDGNGKLVSPEQHKGFMSIFKTTLTGEDLDDTFYPPGQEKYGGVKFWILRGVMLKYVSLHVETATHSCCIDIVPDVLKWANLAEEEDYDDVQECCLRILQLFSMNPPKDMAKLLPQIMELFVNPKHMSNLFSAVNNLYPMNPEPVHNRLQEIMAKFDVLKEAEKSIVIQILNTVAASHPEVLTEAQISLLFQKCQQETPDMQFVYLNVFQAISKKCPEKLQPFFPKLLDDKMFDNKSLSFRVMVIANTAGRDEKLSHKAIDYFMKLASQTDTTVVEAGLNLLPFLVRDHKDYMQKYKATLEKIEKTSTVPGVRQSCNNLIQVLDGKNYEEVFKDLQEQKEFTAGLDKKLDATMGTVITMGEHVTDHHNQLIDVRKDLGELDEKVDELDEDLGETKIKVEEIDNKTMTNAPKWSRDLTKLMNPKHEADWRLLAQRLGYSNDDIRAWSQQHDPSMALLSEWYATHKTSEANFGVLTALTEMNRLDGAAIVENAMKCSEDVVEDEEFEYPSPPPVFLSYQWGMQEEVKLLKQHLNMAGYECWMDIGQMGGGDKLFAKIDNGIRAAKVIICCVTEKYAQSPNCNREVNLSVSLGKPMYPLLMEKMAWPPIGSMGPIFSEYLFIRFFQRAGEETKDNRYWPVPKFQELLMQLNYNVAPDEALIKKGALLNNTSEYKNWWTPIVEEIVIDKKKGASKQISSTQQSEDDSGESPVVFLSYQWGKQPQVKNLFQRIRSLGYTVWMDIFQMGGGDSLYDKIDRGVRGCKVIVSCVTPKYALSANCRREVSLADAIKKPIIPLLLEQMKWPPDGPMSMVFTELLYINVYRDPDVQTKWTGEKFDELAMKLEQYVGGVKESKEATQADQNKNNSARKENNNAKKESKEALVVAKMMEHIKAGGGKASEPKRKADGAASQSKFVEPTTKVSNPLPKATKQPTVTTHKAESKASPEKDAERVNYVSDPQTKESTVTAEPKPQTSASQSKHQRLATNSQRPASNSQRPASNSQNPVSNSQKPASNSEKLAENSQRPASNSQKPASNNPTPANPTETPKSSSCVVL